MRSLLIMLGAVALIVLIGGLYVWMQPTVIPPPVVLRSTTAPVELPPAPEPSTSPSTQPIVGRGTGAWVQVRDDKTNTIAWQSRVAEYTPRPDGSIDVVGPEAEFFLDDGQVLSIQGARGRFIIPGEATRDPALRIGNPPSRGDLEDVILTLYSDETRTSTLLRCVVPNLAFDNDTLRIGTASMQMPDGTVIPADQVPVQLRGMEYDFDGKGLTIRWNARDRRLQSLEIAHGQSMTRKPVAQTLSAPIKPAAPPVATKPPATAPARRGRGTPAPVQAAPATQMADPVYRAIFERDVLVKEGDTPIASAGSMLVDFRLEDRPSSSATPATKPADPPAAAARAAGAARPPATQPSPRASLGPLGPTSTPSDKPITITWSGKLTLVPITDGSIKLEPGELAVELMSVGAPVKVSARGYEFVAASLRHSDRDDSLIARSSELVPNVTLKDPSGTEIITRSINFNGTTGKVVLEGPSSATLVSEGMTAKWQESCTLTLANHSGIWSLAGADIRGDVQLSHPRIKELHTQRMVANFVPVPGDKSGKSDLKDLTATGGVKAQFEQQDGKLREISAETLTVTSTDRNGRPATTQIVADGKVHTADAQQEVDAGRVVVTLVPTTQPTDTPVVEKVIATTDVKFRLKQDNGEAVSGSAVDLTVIPKGTDDYELQLNGSPATISMGGTTLTGPIITASTLDQQARVVGNGTLKSAGPTTRNALKDFDLSWENLLEVNGKTNTASVIGGVQINGSAQDNVRFLANTDKLLLDLADPPATQPTTQPKSKSAGIDSLSKKQIRAVTLDGNTSIRMEETDAQKVLQKRAYIAAPLIRIDPKDDVAISRVTIPSAGKMLLEDFSTPTTRPTTRSGPADLGDFSGPWAFSWSRELVFDNTAQDVKMLGDVTIVHESHSGEPFRLQSNQITAYLAPKAPSTQPATNPTATAIDIQRITADGGVQFTSKRISFQAWEMDFDRAREMIQARGSEGSSIQIFDSSGVSTGSVGEATWNTKTQEITVGNLLIQIRN